MRLPTEYGEAYIRLLNEIDDASPSAFVPYEEMSALAEALFKKFDTPIPEGFTFPQVLSELVRYDWIESNGNGFEVDEQAFRITARGQMRSAGSVDYAEKYRQMVDALPMAPDSPIEYKSEMAPRPDDSAMGHVASEPTITFRPPVVESTSWTGQQFALVDAKVIATIKEASNHLRSTVHAMHFERNSDSANLKGLADALVAICEMAEPEVSIIDRITASPKFKAYASLFAIVATIRGALGI